MEREKALDMAIGQIEKQYGKGAIMRMGEEAKVKVASIPTGALSLDLALGIGGLPRGRVVEVFGPEASGKCLTADTYVWTERGMETIAELFERCGQQASPGSRITDVADRGVRAVNEQGALEKVAALTHNDRRGVLRLRVHSGRTVSATRNHPLRVVDEHGGIVWRQAAHIRPGDRIVSAAFGAVEAAEGEGMAEDDAALVGYLVAEGSRPTAHGSRSAGWGREVDDELTALLETVVAGDGHDPERARRADDGVRWQRTVARRYDLDDGSAAGKKLPYCVRTAGHKAQRAFLSAVFEAHAALGTEEPSIALAFGTEQLAREVQLLLYGFGIPATLRGEPGRAEPEDWTVTIGPELASRFLEEVGFRSPRRRRQAEASLARCSAACGDLARGRVPARATDEQLDSRYSFEEVVAVEDAGVQPTFDLALPRTHSFLANGMLSHNTTVALHAIAEAQRAGGIAAFIDAEHALDPNYAQALGVDVEALLVSQPDTGEQALEIADMIIRSGAVDVVVIDSVAALVPRAEIEGDMGDAHVGLQARLMSQALRKLAGTLHKSRTSAIFINQIREKVGVMFGSPETTSGGRALKFYSSVRLDVRRIESLKDGNDFVGNRVRVKVVKNKVSAPFKQAEFDILFGEGISKEGSILDVGVDQGLIKKAGAWYTYEGEQLGQGRENARRFLKEHTDTAEEIYKKVTEQLGLVPTDVTGEEGDVDGLGS